MSWFFFVVGIIVFIVGLIGTIANIAASESDTGAISIGAGLLVGGGFTAAFAGMEIWG